MLKVSSVHFSRHVIMWYFSGAWLEGPNCDPPTTFGDPPHYSIYTSACSVSRRNQKTAAQNHAFSSAGVGKLFCKRPLVHMCGFVGPVVSVGTTQLCCCSARATVDNP